MRADIQGLRMLAVTLVVVFHLFPTILPGGFIGVDVFFVISGFLITGHLLREVEASGHINIGQFWARRARRLLPAALLVLAFCLALTLLVMPSTTRLLNLGEIAAASVYVLNWVLASSSTDYMAQGTPDSLVQHYWSLSVEEQFYIVWPVLLTVAIVLSMWLHNRKPGHASAGRNRMIRRRAIVAALLIVFALSLAFSIYETAVSQPTAYFVTTTRAWEFALGGFVALVPTSTLPALQRAVVSGIALVALAWTAFAFGPQTAFPGWIALIPVLATAALIWVGDSSESFAPQRLARPKWVQFLGDTSYAVYLWHWPLIVVLAATLASWSEFARALIVVPLTVVLAGITKKYVEDPVRRARGSIRRPLVTFAAVAIATATVAGVALGSSALLRHAIEQRQAELTAPVPEVAPEQQATGPAAIAPGSCIGADAVLNGCENPHAYTDTIDPAFTAIDRPSNWFVEPPADAHCTLNSVADQVERSCNFPAASDDAPQIMLIGDSHAEHVASPIQRAAAANGWGWRYESRAGCSLFSPPDPDDVPLEARCVEWAQQTREAIASDPTIDTVILTVRVALYESWLEEATEGINTLKAAGKNVVVLRDVPEVGVIDENGNRSIGPNCVLLNEGIDDACSWPDENLPDWLVEAANATGSPVIDLHEIMCPGGTCHMLFGGTIAYFDENHLSKTFAATLADWFSRQLYPLVSS